VTKIRGFSLIELIVIIVLLSILSIVAIPRLFNKSAFDSAGFHLDLLSAIRYAQKNAIATGCDVQASVTASSRSYALNYRSGGTDTSCGSGAFSDPVLHPQAQGNFTGTAEPGVVISNDLTIVFNSAGSPSAGGSVSIGSKTITVEAVTGYVH
jgi:MSHA pilin protein MshC